MQRSGFVRFTPEVLPAGLIVAGVGYVGPGRTVVVTLSATCVHNRKSRDIRLIERC